MLYSSRELSSADAVERPHFGVMMIAFTVNAIVMLHLWKCAVVDVLNTATAKIVRGGESQDCGASTIPEFITCIFRAKRKRSAIVFYQKNRILE